MKKKLIREYKKFKHSVRLALESNDTIDDLYLASNIKKVNKEYGNCSIDDNKIVFTNYMGRGYGCNCKYLVKEILRRKLDYKLVWLINDNEDRSVFPKEVKLVDYVVENFKPKKIIAETDNNSVGFYEKYGFTITEISKTYDDAKYLCVLQVN